jgi:archaeal type IV pilus assembly protein PilA
MNYSKIIRKFKKNSKGLSPVVASIILIAVTVAVSVVVAAWMGGMTIGLMGNAEQVSITNYAFAADGSTVTIDVRNTGTATVTISSATMDGAPTTIAGVMPNPAPDPVPSASDLMNIGKGNTVSFTLNAPGSGFSPGAQYSIKIVTAKGTTVPYTVTYNP